MEIIIVAVIVVGALILFALEWLRIDVVALLVIASLILTGILTPAEALTGFSNVATLTVLFMFIVSSALMKTGVLVRVGSYFGKVFVKNYTLGLFFMMIFIAVVSGFINNTPVVALFIPIVIQAAKESKIASSKLLIPLSYASIFGGMCTLIGTSTNILVDGLAREYGAEGFDMFTLAPAGIFMFLAGIIYLGLFSKKLLPDRESKPDEDYRVSLYMAEIELQDGSQSVDQPIRNSLLVNDFGVDILGIIRNNELYALPSDDFFLASGDILKVKCNVDCLQKLKASDVHIRKEVKDLNLESKETSLVELVITTNSRYEGKTLQDVNFRERYQAVPLAIRHREEVINERLMKTILKAGDVVLVEIKNDQLEELKDEEYHHNQPFLVIGEYTNNIINWRNFAIVISCIAGIVILSAFNILHVVGGALIAACILLITGCLKVDEIYEVVDWKIVILLAGSISLGVAMGKTGFSLLVANQAIEFIGPLGPLAILSVIYFLTSMLTEVVSNASAALIAPIAISVARQLDLSPTPFLIAVALAASASFMTPVGYQTNTLIYGAGGYKYKDFMKTGLLLNILFWVLATILIPLFYKF